MERLNASQVELVKSGFHAELQNYRYDIGGSLAELVEDALASALKALAVESRELGVCPACGGRDCDCAHETVDGGELSVWSECAECGHQFIEVFELKRVEKWGDRR